MQIFDSMGPNFAKTVENAEGKQTRLESRAGKICRQWLPTQHPRKKMITMGEATISRTMVAHGQNCLERQS